MPISPVRVSPGYSDCLRAGLRKSENGLLPAVTGQGIRVISTNLLVANEDDAVIWRGPMIAGMIQQFWRDVLWGKLDVLLVDLPPGTSDAALTVMQSLPVNGVVLVTSPQQLAGMVVKKASAMLKQLNVPVLAVVENMSYFDCPKCGEKHEIFGPSHLDELAESTGAEAKVRLPIDPALTTLSDAGQIMDYDAVKISRSRTHTSATGLIHLSFLSATIPLDSPLGGKPWKS